MIVASYLHNPKPEEANEIIHCAQGPGVQCVKDKLPRYEKMENVKRAYDGKTRVREHKHQIQNLAHHCSQVDTMIPS